VKYLYLFFDQHVPRPELSDTPLPRDTALLMGVFSADSEARDRLEALRRQIAEAVNHVRPDAERLRADLMDTVERHWRRTTERRR
jgi:hypothetical protein